MINRNSAPLFERLAEHHRNRTASFHVPGHKYGKGLPGDAESFFAGVMAIDATEITGLDDLHRPEGVIRQAQELAADCFGAEETSFLVGGSTAGNLAMITTIVGRGDILVVPRNVHKSVIHGLALAGARAVFLPPRIDEETGIPAAVKESDVEWALKTYPDAKGVLVTNPNYYGMAKDLAALAALVHGYGKPLLVDEAHGAHFGFHPRLPQSAMACGADAAVQSTHKMLTALTMGAMLHVQGGLIDREKLRSRLAMLQSSSPSYPVLASLDLARREMHAAGRERVSEGLAVVDRVRGELRDHPVLRTVGAKSGNGAYDRADPFKLTLWDASGTLNGHELKDALEASGCMAELAGLRHVLLVFSPFSRAEDAERLIGALRKISSQIRLKKQENQEVSTNNYSIPLFSDISPPVSMEMDTLSGLKPVRELDLREAAGQTAAEMVIPYPPGIPYLYPGERISPQAADQLARLAEIGCQFQGCSDPKLAKIKVWAVK